MMCVCNKIDLDGKWMDGKWIEWMWMWKVDGCGKWRGSGSHTIMVTVTALKRLGRGRYVISKLLKTKTHHKPTGGYCDKR